VVIEPTGSETQVFAKAGDNHLIDALVKDRIEANPGDEVPFLIDTTNVHIFDRKTERKL
jgi:multiple sugar transport system ATP-binding protein